MSEQTSAAGAQGRRRVGVGPGAGGRRGGSRGREHSTRRQEDWSGFAKGLLSGIFITLALGFVLLGAWFQSEDGSPYRNRLPESLGGISASISRPQHDGSDATDTAPTHARTDAPSEETGELPPSTSEPTPQTASGPEQQPAPGQPERAPDGLEGAGVDELLRAHERNQRVVGQAGKLLKAIGGSSK